MVLLLKLQTFATNFEMDRILQLSERNVSNYTKKCSVKGDNNLLNSRKIVINTRILLPNINNMMKFPVHMDIRRSSNHTLGGIK